MAGRCRQAIRSRDVNCQGMAGKTLYPSAIDLFAGAGGATEGLKQAGFKVVAAIESDRAAIATYQANHPEVHIEPMDIRDVDVPAFRAKLKVRRLALDLLKACPPCQGYSSLNRETADDPRNDLVSLVWPFIEEFRPRTILLENVPRLQHDARLRKLIERLKKFKYIVRTYVVDARQFGVPQRRKRFILLASRLRYKPMPADLLLSLDRTFFHRLPTLRSVFRYGRTKTARRDALHNRERFTTSKVRQRIRAIPVGGSRLDLPKRLVLPCHVDIGRNARAAYGRILLGGGVAPTMTTRCTSPSCGAFLHPDEDRAITLREASLIQTFPRRYKFRGSSAAIERQIGNAVPVRMAKGLGLIVRTMI
ncbi:MAG: hypothetical protein JWP08_239 [Bryobacterales bacterium]|nr:hypothetical protein [Bryobacterales bacterium]